MAVSFADVQQGITQIENDNTASNNAISAQIQEVQRLLADFASKDGGPSQADLQAAISQLAAVDSLVKQNTAAVQAVTASIQGGDPAPSNSNPTPAPTATGGLTP